MNFLQKFLKTYQNFSILCLVRWDRPREGRTLQIEFNNFGTPIQMRYTSTEDLRNFWTSYRQCSRYYITLCQVSMDRKAVHWKTLMLWDGKIPISNITLKFNHSEFHCDIVWLLFLLRHFHLCLHICNSLWSNWRTVTWWVLWA
jgi:hypothetical protein